VELVALRLILPVPQAHYGVLGYQRSISSPDVPLGDDFGRSAAKAATVGWLRPP
jgi:hypothetical protein